MDFFVIQNKDKLRRLQILKFPSREIVEQIRKEYPKGTRVVLMQMNDVQAPLIGTQGTVWGVDDTAAVLVHWDNGCGLHVIYGEDECRKISVK